MNNITLIGRLIKDPELRYLQNGGRAVTNFTLAVDKQLSKEKKQEMESRNQPTADFIRVVVWRRMAEVCANYLAKGRLTAVQGRIQTGSYEDKDGKRVYTTEVVANSVEFLEWGDNDQSQNFDSQGSDFSDIEGFHPTDNDDIPF